VTLAVYLGLSDVGKYPPAVTYTTAHYATLFGIFPRLSALFLAAPFPPLLSSLFFFVLLCSSLFFFVLLCSSLFFFVLLCKNKKKERKKKETRKEKKREERKKKNKRFFSFRNEREETPC